MLRSYDSFRFFCRKSDTVSDSTLYILTDTSLFKIRKCFLKRWDHEINAVRKICALCSFIVDLDAEIQSHVFACQTASFTKSNF